jgi:hypothetical protein
VATFRSDVEVERNDHEPRQAILVARPAEFTLPCAALESRADVYATMLRFLQRQIGK